MARSTAGSGSADPRPHLSFDFTVPSQENDYLHSMPTTTTTVTASSNTNNHNNNTINSQAHVVSNQTYISPHVTPLRRKRSASFPEEDDEGDESEERGGGDEEEEDDEDMYMPERGGGPGSSSGRRGVTTMTNVGHYTVASSSSYQRENGFAQSVPSMSGGNGRTSTTTQNRKGAQPIVLSQDGQPPPKKKRRRQALSCTECKRRKIRCDRAHPCAPCTRRGEGDKCKWNILEPVEKFVTRKEYDEIKYSLSRLENILTTTSPSGQGASTTATEEVAAAVNLVKKQAGILSKVISDVPNSAAAALSSIDNRARGGTLYGNMATSSTSGIPPPPSSSHARNIGSNGGDNNASFAYHPFALNVPSQSTAGALSDPGDEEYYGSAQQHHNTISSHSTSSDFSRPTTSTYPPPPSTSSHIHQLSAGHFQPNATAPTANATGSNSNAFAAPAYHSRIPEINLGGLVVEDQSHTSGAASHRAHADNLYKADPAASLSTLANVANASSMASSSRRSNSGNSHLQASHYPNQNASVAMGQIPSPSLTLPPIAGQDFTSSGRQHSLSLSTSADNADIVPMSIVPPRLPTPKDREAQLLHVLHTCLPRREICDRLVEYYFEKVEWSITLLHRISFMRAYETFWFLSEDERVKFISPPTPTSATSWGGGFRASFLPPTSDQPSGYGRPGPKSPLPKARSSLPDDGHVTPAWISLLLALLCASLERLGYWDAKSVGIVETVDHYQILCRRLYDGSQGVMIIGDFLKSRALESIQALVLLLHCHQTISNTQWEAQLGTTLSVAVRLGMLMGLNKLSPEKVGSAQRPGLLKRELGRRAWWNLVERDWSLSPRVGHSYAVNPAQNFCDFPANTGWEEFSFRQSAFKQQPRGIWTSASLFLARIDVARGNRELTDQYNSLDGVSYNALLKHEVMMEETICRAPRQLIKVDGEFELSTPQGQWNRIQFTFHAHYNAITLHRPYIIAALLDVKAEEQRQSNSQTGSSHPRRQTAYLPSLDTAIGSAEVILDTMEEAISSQYPGMQWWQTIICCYTAAVVLLVERWYKLEAKAGTLESEDAEERRRKIQAASALLREQCDAVDLFAQAANALDSLLDATTSARRKARKSGRRGMDINDVVNPVNVSSRASVSSGNTPPFVKEWIDRPNTPMPTPESNPPPPPSSLSTMTLLPGTPLVVDASYDSQFWARIFDLEFQAPPDMADLFFPSYESQGADEMGDQAMANTEGGANGSGVGNLGGSAIWNAVSGSIGSSSNGDGWPRASPYGNTGGS